MRTRWFWCTKRNRRKRRHGSRFEFSPHGHWRSLFACVEHLWNVIRNSRARYSCSNRGFAVSRGYAMFASIFVQITAQYACP